MAAITGGKYASRALSSAGTSTVTISTGTFVSGDFTVTRLVGLWNSAGTTFKGMAWVRRFVSTTVLELETVFFDPATGASVTQVVGDTILVSQNFAEAQAAAATYTVSGRTVTLSATTVFGSAASNSCCFYDESKEITAPFIIQFAGGLTVWGKLDNYSVNTVSSPCDLYLTMASPIPVAVSSTGTASNVCMYGGVISTNSSGTHFVGAFQGTAGYTMVFNSVQTSVDFISPDAGGPWGTNAARMQLVNCASASTTSNGILVRWGNGVISGGSYKLPRNTDQPISIFGSDALGTYTIAAPAGNRAIVLDMGNGPALVRTNGGVMVFNFTNLITTDFRSVTGTSGALVANASGTNTFRFSDSYTALQSGSLGVILDNTNAVAQSISSSGTTWSPSLLRRTCVGATETVNATSWTYGFKKYGYLPVSGSISPATYSLGTAGNADNVSFGGAVIQKVDDSVSLSQAAAAALTTIATLDHLYDAAINFGTSSVTNAQYPSLDLYPAVASGTVVDLGSSNLVIDATAGSAFSVNTGTNTITIKSSVLSAGVKFQGLTTAGTVSFANGATSTVPYTDASGSITILTIACLSGSTVAVFDGSLTQQNYDASSDGTYTLSIASGATGTWTWVADKAGYTPARGTFTPASGGLVSVSASMPQKLNPDGTAMYQATTSSLVAVSFSGTTNAFIDIGDGAAPLQAAFDESEVALTTTNGMKWLASGKADINQFNSGSGDFLFLTTGWRLRRASAGDGNAAIQAFVQSTDGTPVDDTNGSVQFLSSDSPTAIAAAVRANLADLLDVAVSTRATQVSADKAVANAALAAALSA